jgi:hypothetical protein
MVTNKLRWELYSCLVLLLNLKSMNRSIFENICQNHSFATITNAYGRKAWPTPLSDAESKVNNSWTLYNSLLKFV